MVVQCKRCGTKFNFDEALIEGEGVWCRCGQCKNVFFLSNPAKQDAAVPPDKEKSGGIGLSEAGGARKKDVKDLSSEVKHPEPEFFKDTERKIDDIDKDVLTSVEKTGGDEIGDDKDSVEEEFKRKRGLTRGKQLIYLFIVLMIGAIYLLFFTETSGLLLFEKLLGTGPKIEEVGPAQVELTDVRQRLINNAVIGTIRVIEGTAVNQSSLPMTRIKVKGEITDAYTVVLGVRESYCGNILTSDELVTMTEEQIQRELSNPLGSDVPNDRIGSKGQIPFMIVFTREPPVVVKAFVTPVGAERLLP
jgi:predicted Zn finger-like uncharacterized protein